MNELLESGNFAGLLGLSLMAYVGFRLARTGHLGGWLLAAGAGLFAFARLFRLYAEPLLHEPLHRSFNHFSVTLVTSLPTITFALGIILIPLGIVFIALRQHNESVAVATVTEEEQARA